jgi:YfiH family protein
VLSSTRNGGISRGAWASLNLATHVGDDPAAVAENRRLLRVAGGLPAEPLWLEQVHGVDVVVHSGQGGVPRADAAVAFEPGRVCVVMTADCLPVVLADRGGTRVGVAHAGWRGLAGGVIEATVAALGASPETLVAWLGPAIGQPAFEVGPEVRDAFVTRDPRAAACFEPNARGRHQADLRALARLALARSGVVDVAASDDCTAEDHERYFSHRRDGAGGRMATLAWIEPTP